ncbi:type IV secretory pathway VirB3 family protein [Sphingobium chlorophenolicum L-1]|uniref:Type IV secretory pathway VirB3 family protein n=1 Tax=Sphingobium chlorophenolicum L-1 TaxID=690566 RepID=F6EYH4_SPHCR|nr:type IV secretion system protein VirB3 [Sphingobium chlorophenolicum]AEG49176.1 type IV secretory pathway VirB3 family protein [Sphingobium chlorophenolicum L-1]
MSSLKQETVFIALTRPQMFAGVTYSYFVINMVIAAELFLLFKSLWSIVIAALLHACGVLLCLREPRFFDLWIARVSLCPRIKNYRLWGCNSYRP